MELNWLPDNCIGDETWCHISPVPASHHHQWLPVYFRIYFKKASPAANLRPHCPVWHMAGASQMKTCQLCGGYAAALFLAEAASVRRSHQTESFRQVGLRWNLLVAGHNCGRNESNNPTPHLMHWGATEKVSLSSSWATQFMRNPSKYLNWRCFFWQGGGSNVKDGISYLEFNSQKAPLFYFEVLLLKIGNR